MGILNPEMTNFAHNPVSSRNLVSETLMRWRTAS